MHAVKKCKKYCSQLTILLAKCFVLLNSVINLAFELVNIIESSKKTEDYL